MFSSDLFRTVYPFIQKKKNPQHFSGVNLCSYISLLFEQEYTLTYISNYSNYVRYYLLLLHLLLEILNLLLAQTDLLCFCLPVLRTIMPTDCIGL